MTNSLNYLDLFSGIGGFALGLYQAGWRFTEHLYSEIDTYANRLYRKRFPDSIALGDVRKINGNALAKCYPGGWFITGGFPCQDISVAGKGGGITGERSRLWFECGDLLASYDPATSSLKTSVQSLFEDSTPSCLRLPRQGMMQSGNVYAQKTLVRRIKGNGYGLWPTPMANSGKAAWHSPKKKGGMNLQTAVKMYPTPVAQDAKNSTLPPSQAGRGTIPGRLLQEKITGTLNPRWVEWLMGYPIGWTDCEDSEMRLSLKSQN